ncbi:MAG: GlsB/YeaQ/YmgE family stress response membrane protein [Actinomycetota bacterium]|nr:GlsB/YeaQ/YmgE family stress response membrane protein [Actinomycetota bacterium]
MFVIGLLIIGLVIGALARLAVPGPDPMPIWMTIAVGLAGSIIAGVISRLLFGTGAGILLAFICSVGVVIAYRRFVQHRPITGPGARDFPRR